MANTNRRHTLDQAGEYTLDRCEIVSYKNAEDNRPRTVDIKLITGSIELVENIYQSCMIGKIQVFDSNDIRTILPITGFEKLNLKFQTPGQTGVDHTEENGRQFHIYKIESVSQDDKAQRTQGYDIFFTSRESYFNLMSKVSKAYSGPIEDAIEDILRNKRYLNSSRALVFEPTKTNAKYVIPSLRPFEAIKYLCTQAISQKYNNAGYCFYETQSGFKFKSIDKLISQEPVAEYLYTDANQSSTETDTSNRILQYKTTVNNNLLAKLRTGRFSSYRVYWNPLTFQFTPPDLGVFRREDYVGGVKNLGNEMVLPEVENASGQTISLGDVPSRVITGVQDIGTLGDKDDKSANADPGKYHSQALMRYNSLFTQQIKMAVPCNTDLEAGMVIKCRFPSVTTGKNKKETPDPVQSGLYMIKDLCHYFSGQESYTYMTLVRDTVGLYNPNT